MTPHEQIERLTTAIVSQDRDGIREGLGALLASEAGEMSYRIAAKQPTHDTPFRVLLTSEVEKLRGLCASKDYLYWWDMGSMIATLDAAVARTETAEAEHNAMRDRLYAVGDALNAAGAPACDTHAQGVRFLVRERDEAGTEVKAAVDVIERIRGGMDRAAFFGDRKTVEFIMSVLDATPIGAVGLTASRAPAEGGEKPKRSRCPTCGKDGRPNGTLGNGAQVYTCDDGHGAWSEPNRYQRLVPGWRISEADYTDHERRLANAPTGDDPYREPAPASPPATARESEAREHVAPFLVGDEVRIDNGPILGGTTDAVVTSVEHMSHGWQVGWKTPTGGIGGSRADACTLLRSAACGSCVEQAREHAAPGSVWVTFAKDSGKSIFAFDAREDAVACECETMGVAGPYTLDAANQADEIRELRRILVAAVKAIGCDRTFVTETASLAFLAHVPEEITLAFASARAEVASADARVREAREAAIEECVRKVHGWSGTWTELVAALRALAEKGD